MAEQVIGWRHALRGSTDLKVCGCALAWCLANGRNVSQVHGVSQNAGTLFEAGMRHRTGRKRSVFPLCEGEFFEALRFFRSVSFAEASTEACASQWSTVAWTMLACFACQTLDSGYLPFKEGKWSKMEKRLASAVERSVGRLQSHGQVSAIDFASVEKDFLSSRLSYEGEEIGICHKLSFVQVLPALPPSSHGGAIDVLDFVCSSTRYWLERPEKLLVEDTGQWLPKLQGRVHVEKDELTKIADELVKRGVCNWIPFEKVVEFRGQKVLNGLFGVTKPGLAENNKPILRLIMNLVPSNSVLKQFKGFTKRLPHITSWLSTFVDEGEELRIWQSDMSNAFYLFKLPVAWQPFLTFNVVRCKCDVVNSDDTSLVALACAVLPMGWGSSVSIMQEISEHILRAGSMPMEGQLVRGRPLPTWMVGVVQESRTTGKNFWHIYLDNFAAGEVGPKGSTFEDGTAIHDEAECLWKSAGVVSADKKRKCAELTAQELGAQLDGSARTMGPSLERMIKLVHATVVLLSRKSLSRKLVQVLAGRWVHVFQFRRPAMSFLEATWEYVSSTGVRIDLQMKVRREMFACMCALPLVHTFLGANISEVLTASDASHFGGAVGISRQLTSAGEDFVRSTLRPDPFLKSNIMVISLFHGIGGSFRTYDILGIRADVLVAFDIHKPAMRVTSRRWPHAELYGDVRTLDESMLEDLLQRHPEVTEVHLWGGFPCVDLSSVNVMGRGLAGPQSSLFFEFKRILLLLRSKAPSHVTIKFIAENVASMPKHECERITAELRVKPYHLNCADAVPMQRPRLCWTSESLEGCLEGLSFRETEYWTEVTAEAEYPEQSQWVEPPFWWPGGEQNYTLPTALKSIERKRPPPGPAGLHRCDQDTLARRGGATDLFQRSGSMELALLKGRTTLRPTREQLLEGSVERPPEPPPWGLIGGLLSVPFALICIAVLLSKLGVFREAVEPLFHSSKAVVVAHDTFIEPQTDLMVNGLGIETKTYGRVEPRALGLRKEKEDQEVIPLALRQRPENAVPEAANAAWVDEVVKEASIQDEVPQLNGTMVLHGTTFSGAGVICSHEELDMPYTESHVLALTSGAHHSHSSDRSKSMDDLGSQHQSVVSGLPSLSNTARSARGANRSTSKLTSISDLTLMTGITGVTVTERPLSSQGLDDDDVLHQETLPEPPTEVVLPEIGHVEGSVSGLVLNPVSVGNLHRPAAAAKRLRQQGASVPRVAT
eukprot:s2074_g5.t1